MGHVVSENCFTMYILAQFNPEAILLRRNIRLIQLLTLTRKLLLKQYLQSKFFLKEWELQERKK